MSARTKRVMPAQAASFDGGVMVALATAPRGTGDRSAREDGAVSRGVTAVTDARGLPFLLTADEVAGVLRTTRKAIYARAERGLLPGALRDGRRLLVERDVLLGWLEERRATSPGGSGR